MGHAKPSMSLDVYSHVMPPDELEPARLIALTAAVRATTTRIVKIHHTCRWCGKKKDPMVRGALCERCRAKADKGEKPAKADAMDRRAPGSFGTGKRR